MKLATFLLTLAMIRSTTGGPDDNDKKNVGGNQESNRMWVDITNAPADLIVYLEEHVLERLKADRDNLGEGPYNWEDVIFEMSAWKKYAMIPIITADNTSFVLECAHAIFESDMDNSEYHALTTTVFDENGAIVAEYLYTGNIFEQLENHIKVLEVVLTLKWIRMFPVNLAEKTGAIIRTYPNKEKWTNEEEFVYTALEYWRGGPERAMWIYTNGCKNFFYAATALNHTRGNVFWEVVKVGKLRDSVEDAQLDATIYNRSSDAFLSQKETPKEYYEDNPTAFGEHEADIFVYNERDHKNDGAKWYLSQPQEMADVFATFHRTVEIVIHKSSRIPENSVALEFATPGVQLTDELKGIFGGRKIASFAFIKYAVFKNSNYEHITYYCAVASGNHKFHAWSECRKYHEYYTEFYCMYVIFEKRLLSPGEVKYKIRKISQTYVGRNQVHDDAKQDIAKLIAGKPLVEENN